LARITETGYVEVDEGIDELKIVAADELDEMLRSEQLTDSFTLAAILQARVRGLIG